MGEKCEVNVPFQPVFSSAAVPGRPEPDAAVKSFVRRWFRVDVGKRHHLHEKYFGLCYRAYFKDTISQTVAGL